MQIKVIVTNRGESGESCEVYVYRATEVKVEVVEQQEPDQGG